MNQGNNEILILAIEEVKERKISLKKNGEREERGRQ